MSIHFCALFHDTKGAEANTAACGLRDFAHLDTTHVLADVKCSACLVAVDGYLARGELYEGDGTYAPRGQFFRKTPNGLRYRARALWDHKRGYSLAIGPDDFCSEGGSR